MSFFTGKLPRPIPHPKGDGKELPTAPDVDEFISETICAYESSLHPFDVDLVRAIRRDIDPDFVPVTILAVFRKNGQERVIENHAIAHMNPSPFARQMVRNVLWPSGPGINSGFSSRGVLIIDSVLHGQEREQFRALSWGDYFEMKQSHHRWRHRPSPEEEARIRYEAREREKAAIQKQINDEHAYRLAEDGDRLYDAFSKLSQPEIDAWGETSQADRKPFVHLRPSVRTT